MLSFSPLPATVPVRGEKEELGFPCLTAGQTVGSLPLRRLLRRRERAGTADLRLRLVDSGVRVSAGGAVVAEASSGRITLAQLNPHRDVAPLGGVGELVATDARGSVGSAGLGFLGVSTRWRRCCPCGFCLPALPLWPRALRRRHLHRLACVTASWGFRAVGGEAVAAPTAVDFVPVLFLRVVGGGSDAGDEFFGSLYRSRPRCVLAGCNCSEAWDVEDGGSCVRSPATEGGGAQFRGVRGSSPADAAQLASSHRPRARWVSLEVLQLMVLARSFGGWMPVFFVSCWCFRGGGGRVRQASLGLLLLLSLVLCLFPDRSGQSSMLGMLVLYRSNLL